MLIFVGLRIARMFVVAENEVSVHTEGRGAKLRAPFLYLGPLIDLSYLDASKKNTMPEFAANFARYHSLPAMIEHSSRSSRRIEPAFDG